MSNEPMQQTLERSERLVVTVSLGDTHAEFSGSPEAVLQSVNNFISKTIPEIDLAKKLSMNFSAKDLVEKFKDFVRITPEGPRIISDQTKLSDKEMIALQLSCAKDSLRRPEREHHHG